MLDLGLLKLSFLLVVFDTIFIYNNYHNYLRPLKYILLNKLYILLKCILKTIDGYMSFQEVKHIFESEQFGKFLYEIRCYL